MNLHKIYVFKLTTFDPKIRLEHSLITDLRKIQDCEASKTLFANVLLRSESVLFYYQRMIYETALSENDHNVLDSELPFDHALSRKFMTVSRHYLFYFDTIVNQIVSLYEYLANCSSYLLIGNHASNFKWKKSIAEIKSRGYDQLASTLEKINFDFMNDLYEIRAGIFHYGFLKMSSSYSHDWQTGKVEMKFSSDKKVHHLLTKASLVEKSDEPVGVREAANFIIEKSLRYVIDILEALKITLYNFNRQSLKAPKSIDRIFADSGFENMYQFTQAFVYHWGYYWDDTAQFQNLDYMNRKFNEMTMALRFFPED